MLNRDRTAARPDAGRLTLLCLCLAALLCLPGCIKTGSKAKAPVNPNDKNMAYGVTVAVAPPWDVAVMLPPERISKEALEQKRMAGERVLLMAALLPPAASGIENIFQVFLVNPDNTFMPREFAEKLQPQEYAALSRDLLEREKATAKKNKSPVSVMDLQLSRETMNGNFTVHHKATVAGPQGAPMRSLRWDIYLPGGAGIAVLADYDAELPGAEQAALSMARSLRVQ